MASPVRRTPKREFGPVTVTTVAERAGSAWTVEQVRDLVRQGYGVDKVVAMTGFDRRWVQRQVAARDAAEAADS